MDLPRIFRKSLTNDELYLEMMAMFKIFRQDRSPDQSQARADTLFDTFITGLPVYFDERCKGRGIKFDREQRRYLESVSEACRGRIPALRGLVDRLIEIDGKGTATQYMEIMTGFDGLFKPPDGGSGVDALRRGAKS